MQRYTISAAASVLLLLGACAGQPEVPDDTLSYATASPDAETVAQIRANAKSDPVVTAAAMANADEIICVREAPTSSYIRVRRCYTRSQLERQAKLSQAILADEQARNPSIRELSPVVPSTE